jgi:hypothetical protein
MQNSRSYLYGSNSFKFEVLLDPRLTRLCGGGEGAGTGTPWNKHSVRRQLVNETMRVMAFFDRGSRKWRDC